MPAGLNDQWLTWTIIIQKAGHDTSQETRWPFPPAQVIRQHSVLERTALEAGCLTIWPPLFPHPALILVYNSCIAILFDNDICQDSEYLSHGYLEGLKENAPSITDVKHLSSYN